MFKMLMNVKIGKNVKKITMLKNLNNVKRLKQC